MATARPAPRLPFALAFVALTACAEADDTSSDGASDFRQGYDEIVPVDPAKELVITDASVIDSPVETTFDPAHPSGTSKHGAWSFGRLVHNMLPKPKRNSAAAASKLVMRWLATWESDQSPNPGVGAAKARPAIRLLVTNPWKAASGCAQPESPATDATCVLDMTKAPFELLAIVNRPDLRRAGDDAIGGEGRFVFQVVGPTLGIDATTNVLGVMDATPKPQKFTVIFEYALPVDCEDDTLDWAERWHELGEKDFGHKYNKALRAITNDFAGPNADPSKPNGNALNQLRTNEVALMGARFPTEGFVAAKQFWELREFHLAADGLRPHTVNLEPARDFDIAKVGQVGTEGTRTTELVDYLIANADAVLASTNVLPTTMSGNAALVGSAPYGAWGKLVNPNPPTIASQGVAHDLDDVAVGVRDVFAMNTCAGCHRHETDTRHFMHITMLGAMEPADKVDDRARVGIEPGTPEDTIVLSNLLTADISPGGGRYENFTALLLGETP
jgi:hypothetical protein